MMGCYTRAKLASEILPCKLLSCSGIYCRLPLQPNQAIVVLDRSQYGYLTSREDCFCLSDNPGTSILLCRPLRQQILGFCRAIAGGSRTRSVVHRIALYSRHMHISHIISQSDIAR